MTATPESAVMWSTIDNRRDAIELQKFTCTVDRPRTPENCTLPHPMPWEWEAQRHIRSLFVHYKDGDHLVVGRRGGAVIAAAQSMSRIEGEVLDVFIAAAAVAANVRR